MCTSFAVYHQERAIYGMNFDTEEIDDMNIFYFSALMDNKYRDIAGFNSEGFFVCTHADKTGDAFILEVGNDINIVSPSIWHRC